MNTNRNINNVASILMITVILIGICVIDVSAAPGNDYFADATVIEAFPYNDSSNTSTATIDPGDPWTCVGQYKSIWYSYTPDSNVNLSVSALTDYGYSVTLSIYSAESGGLSQIQCLDGEQINANVELSAGTTYYIELMARYTGGQFPYPDPPSDPDGGNVTLNINQIFPPANDNFAIATSILGTPFSDSVDTTYATTEYGEPNYCGWNFQKTIWYKFSPGTSGSYTAEATGGYYPLIAVYTGEELFNLQQQDCKSDWNIARSTLWLEAGETYYYQIYIQYEYWGWNINFTINPTPPPVADFYYGPGDPSKYDGVQFYNNSYDPYGSGIETCTWDFGDGSAAVDCYPIHQFSADGDYSVHLAVTTYDGRAASTTQTIQVRTHDVGVTRFVVPSSARVGQTKQINVSIKNLYYEETVQVDLYKSTANGYVWVGSLTQTMPVRPANRAQVFPFAYTFSSDDAIQGKVIFKAVVTIINARDAYTADNEMISLATKVSR